jgi:hypothetical protein
MATLNRKITRNRIHQRIRKHVAGTAARPRLSVHFSGKHVYAQVVDDDAGRTLAAAATTEKSLGGKGIPRIASPRRKLARPSLSDCSQKKSTGSYSIAADFFIMEK